MPLFQSENLDLSRLPDPTLVTIDYEVALAERMAALKAAFAAWGIDYDETELELDTGKILEEVDAGREIIALQAINDAGLANMLAFSRGSNLEHLGALFGVVRRQLGVDNDGAVIWESDDLFRRRIQLAPEAMATAGSAGGYIFHALSADPNLADASVQNPAPGEVVVTVMGNGLDPEPTVAQVDAARAHLFEEDIKPITDILTVQGAQVIEVDIVANLVVYPGPDHAVVVADARANLERFLALNKRLGRDLRLNAWLGRLHRDTVHSVAPVAPVADVNANPAQVVWVKSITLNAIGVDE